MKRTFILTMTFFWTLTSAHGQSNNSCDTTTFYKLIRAQVKYFDKQTKSKYLISNKIIPDNDTLPRESNNKLCADITIIEKIATKKGSITTSDTFDNNTLVYFIYTPAYNQRLDNYIVKVRHRDGEWGGATVIYHYKKKGKTFKWTKKSVVSVS